MFALTGAAFAQRLRGLKQHFKVFEVLFPSKLCQEQEALQLLSARVVGPFGSRVNFS